MRRKAMPRHNRLQADIIEGARRAKRRGPRMGGVMVALAWRVGLPCHHRRGRPNRRILLILAALASLHFAQGRLSAQDRPLPDPPFDKRPADWDADEKDAGLARWPYFAELVLPKNPNAATKYGVI